MSEPRPTYEPDPTTVIANAAAAQEWFGRLTAYAAALRQRVEAGNLDAATLRAIAAQVRDLRQCAEALAVGLTALFLLLAPARPVAAESPPELPALLFVITGQSNAGPKGSGGEAVPGAWLYAPRDVGEFWTPMAGLGRSGRYGVGLPFARAVHEATGRTVLIVNVYSGGTSIIAWQPDAPSAQWRRAMSAVGNGNKRPMYPQVRQAVVDATAAWGGPVEVAGVLYVQVERDSRQKQPTYYEGALRRLIAAWRADYGDGLPVMFIDAHTHMSSGGPMVAAAVRAVAADTPRTALILVGGVEKNPQEPAHFSSAGVGELGRRFAAAWLEMEK